MEKERGRKTYQTVQCKHAAHRHALACKGNCKSNSNSRAETPVRNWLACRWLAKRTCDELLRLMVLTDDSELDDHGELMSLLQKIRFFRIVRRRESER